MAEKIKKETENVKEEVKTEVKTEMKTEKAVEIPKKVKKPREKVRDVRETIELPLSKLTDKEKDKLIKALKEENTLLANKVELYKQNAATAYEQSRQAESNFDAMETFYRDKLKYIVTQMNAFTSAVEQAVVMAGGTK